MDWISNALNQNSLTVLESWHLTSFPIPTHNEQNKCFLDPLLFICQINVLTGLNKRRQGNRTDDGSIISPNWAVVHVLTVDGQWAMQTTSQVITLNWAMEQCALSFMYVHFALIQLNK